MASASATREQNTRDIAGGNPYNAGDDLSVLYTPIHRETKIGGVSFAGRFWDDGSARLTAYEYQGILDSACFQKGEPGSRINCMSCHTMHEGDVKGQITEAKRTNLACTQCHAQFAEPAVLTQHTRHSANSEGSSCIRVTCLRSFTASSHSIKRTRSPFLNHHSLLKRMSLMHAISVM